jgi:hypothetical protein
LHNRAGAFARRRRWLLVTRDGELARVGPPAPPRNGSPHSRPTKTTVRPLDRARRRPAGGLRLSTRSARGGQATALRVPIRLIGGHHNGCMSFVASAGRARTIRGAVHGATRGPHRHGPRPAAHTCTLLGGALRICAGGGSSKLNWPRFNSHAGPKSSPHGNLSTAQSHNGSPSSGSARAGHPIKSPIR